jgi:conjugative transfer region protein (TIGR03750 family)
MENEFNSDVVNRSVNGHMAPLTDRINAEPQILNGMSHSEIMLFGGLFFTINMLVFSLAAFITDWYLILLPMPLLGTTLCIWYFSKHLAKTKENRPDGFHVQYMKTHFVKMGLIHSQVITWSDYWSLGRIWD